MLTTTGTRRQRAFWAALVSAWIAMLVITVLTHGEHVLIVPAWGILVGVLGIAMLIDRGHVFHAYRRGMPASVSVAEVRRVVTFSGFMLAVIGILVTTVGCIRVWREFWAGL